MNMKKWLSLLLAALMLMSMATAFADVASTTIPQEEFNYIMPLSADGTITVANPVASKEYTAYKIFDVVYSATGSNYTYTINKSSPWFDAVSKYSGLELTQVRDTDTYVLTSHTFSAPEFAAYLYKFVDSEENPADITDPNAKKLETAAGGATQVTQLDHGYYFVTSSLGSLCSLTTTDPDATIYEKNDHPTIEKKIVEDGNTVDYNNAAIGDTVHYEITSKVPAMEGYTKYIFKVTDVLSKGLTYTANSMVVKINGTALTVDTHYTVTTTNNQDGTTTIVIDFKDFIQHKDKLNQPITITYDAVVNENAVIGEKDGNPNKVKLEYSNDPAQSGQGEEKPSTKETEWDEVITYVTEIILKKVDEKSTPLAGATFKLTGTKLNTVLVKHQETTTDEDGQTTTTNKVTTITKTEDVEYKAITGPDGKLTFTGLAAGTYTITELIAPDGYNLLTSPITVTIGWAQPSDSTSKDCTWSYSWSGITGAENNKTNTITVVNTTGSSLPSTGGMGTTILYAVGGVLVLAAFVLIVTKRRASEN